MTIYSGFSHWKWWFSIVMLVYQRLKNIGFITPAANLRWPRYSPKLGLDFVGRWFWLRPSTCGFCGFLSFRNQLVDWNARNVIHYLLNTYYYYCLISIIIVIIYHQHIPQMTRTGAFQHPRFVAWPVASCGECSAGLTPHDQRAWGEEKDVRRFNGSLPIIF